MLRETKKETATDTAEGAPPRPAPVQNFFKAIDSIQHPFCLCFSFLRLTLRYFCECFHAPIVLFMFLAVFFLECILLF